MTAARPGAARRRSRGDPSERHDCRGPEAGEGIQHEVVDAREGGDHARRERLREVDVLRWHVRALVEQLASRESDARWRLTTHPRLSVPARVAREYPGTMRPPEGYRGTPYPVGPRVVALKAVSPLSPDVLADDASVPRPARLAEERGVGAVDLRPNRAVVGAAHLHDRHRRQRRPASAGRGPMRRWRRPPRRRLRGAHDGCAGRWCRRTWRNLLSAGGEGHLGTRGARPAVRPRLGARRHPCRGPKVSGPGSSVARTSCWPPGSMSQGDIDAAGREPGARELAARRRRVSYRCRRAASHEALRSCPEASSNLDEWSGCRRFERGTSGASGSKSPQSCGGTEQSRDGARPRSPGAGVPGVAGRQRETLAEWAEAAPSPRH